MSSNENGRVWRFVGVILNTKATSSKIVVMVEMAVVEINAKNKSVVFSDNAVEELQLLFLSSILEIVEE